MAKADFTGEIMNKPELIAAVQEKTGSNKKDATASVNAVFKIIEEHLAKGNKVQIVGHGTYATVDREARTGRNPQTKEPIQIPAKRVPTFDPGKGLKDAVLIK